MIITEKKFKEVVPANKRSAVEEYMKFDGWYKRHDGTFVSGSDFVWLGNGTSYLQNVLRIQK